MHLSSLFCCAAHPVNKYHSDDDHPQNGSATTSTATNTVNGVTPVSLPPAIPKPPPTPPKKPTKSSKKDSASQPEPYTHARASALFETYEDTDEPDVIGPGGFERLCEDAKVSMEGPLALVLAWQLGSSEMAKVKKSEWENATSELKISSLPALSLALHDLEDLILLDKPPQTSSNVHKKSTSSTSSLLSDEPYSRSRYYKYAADKGKAFSELYVFCFNLAKPPQGRNIDIETACAFWTVLVAPKYPLIQDLVEFVNEKQTYKGVNKDLWSMTLEFCQTMSPSLDDYEADGAWPTMLDEFVAWKKSKAEA